MMHRVCPQCNSPKCYDPSAKPKSKASGFHQTVCWDCYLENQRKAVNDYYYREKRRSATCQACGAEVRRAYYYKEAQMCASCYHKGHRHAA